MAREHFTIAQVLQVFNLTVNVTEIGQNGFAKCSGLTGTLTLPEGLITIGASALVSMTNINKVIVPSTVTYVGSNAFSIMTNAVLVLLKTNNVLFFCKSVAIYFWYNSLE